MSTLIILGNTNQYTFANTILAANKIASKIFDGNSLDEIFVFHSSDSYKELSQKVEWINHLEKSNINRDIITETIIEVSHDDDSIRNFIKKLGRVISSIDDHSKVIIDLSNGPSTQRHILTVLGYVLDIHSQYVIDSVLLRSIIEKTQDGINQSNKIGFLPINILEQIYVSTPDTTLLDDISFLGLTEMIRYNKQIIKMAEILSKDTFDSEFFSKNLIQSIKLKLAGDRTGDNSTYRIATSSLAGSIEEVLTYIINEFTISSNDRLMLGQKIELVQKLVRDCNFDKSDIEFINIFNQFILYLRNSTTHKGKILTDIERFKAELSIKMAFPYIKLYTDIILPELNRIVKDNRHEETDLVISNFKSSTAENIIYYGLDGDDTGKEFERLFINSQNEKDFIKLSTNIDKAIKEIKKQIQDKSVVYAAGDDILFKGNFEKAFLVDLQRTYFEITGLTCSIGYGTTINEAYIALKLAKAEPQKNSIKGIWLKSDEIF